jgi:hypothetical protein
MSDDHSRKRIQRDLLSKKQLETALTDVRAEAYLVEAERLRMGRLISAVDRQSAPDEFNRLLRRQDLIERRLEELDASTAGLRARFERLNRLGSSSASTGDDVTSPNGTSSGTSDRRG